MQYIEKLENGLIFRTVDGEKDIVRYSEFNTRYNNIYEGRTCDCLLRHHPAVSHNDFQLIEDERSGEILSTTCLIPWVCSYEGITLNTAMLEMVLTHPGSRKMGLVRKQVKRFLSVVEQQKYDLSIIWGIPYYYRQYGYTYCIWGNSSESLPTWRIPDTPSANSPSLELRIAGIEHIPVLTLLYNDTVKKQQIHIKRSSQYWEYMIKWAKFPVWIVQDKRTGNVQGYLIMKIHDAGKRVTIMESSIKTSDTGSALLQTFKRDNFSEIVISWPENSILAELARSYGSISDRGGQWLLRITDVADFLMKIGPVIERRLTESEYADVTDDIIINLFHQAYILHFETGKLMSVEKAGFIDASMSADGGHLCIPPEAFVRLVFGFRALDELFDAWPDIVVKPEVRHLLDVLFPRLVSYISTPYHYQGPI